MRQFTCPKYFGSIARSTFPVLTGLDVEQLRWSRPTRYRYTKPPSKEMQRSSSSHAQIVLTVTAEPASRVKAAMSKAAWWLWPWKWCPRRQEGHLAGKTPGSTTANESQIADRVLHRSILCTKHITWNQTLQITNAKFQLHTPSLLKLGSSTAQTDRQTDVKTLFSVPFVGCQLSWSVEVPKLVCCESSSHALVWSLYPLLVWSERNSYYTKHDMKATML